MTHASPVSAVKMPINLTVFDPTDHPLSRANDIAQLLLRFPPAYALSSALVMHKQAARSLDVDLIEHWAGIASDLFRMIDAQQFADWAQPRLYKIRLEQEGKTE